MLVQTVSITKCVLPFRDRRAVDIVEAQKHTLVICWFKGTIIQTISLPFQADRSCRHGRNAARVLTRTRILVQKIPRPFPGVRFFCRSTITGAVDLVEAQSRKHAV